LPFRNLPDTEKHANIVNSTRVAWQVFITARQFIRKLKNWVCNHVSLGSNARAARRFHLLNPKQPRKRCVVLRFLEIPENTIIHEIIESMYSIYHTLMQIPTRK